MKTNDFMLSDNIATWGSMANFPIRTFAPARPLLYNVARWEGGGMKKITLTVAEWRLVIHALNKLRNSLIAEGRYTDVIDETLLKIINAPTRKVKVPA